MLGFWSNQVAAVSKLGWRERCEPSQRLQRSSTISEDGEATSDLVDKTALIFSILTSHSNAP